MKTKRRYEGYLMIDHRDSPGISPEFAAQNNLPVGVRGGQLFESAIAVCNHCGSDVLLHPDRSRPREWCSRCDSYICDNCGAAAKVGAPHVTYMQSLEDAYEELVKGLIIKKKESNP